MFFFYTYKLHTHFCIANFQRKTCLIRLMYPFYYDLERKNITAQICINFTLGVNRQISRVHITKKHSIENREVFIFHNLLDGI